MSNIKNISAENCYSTIKENKDAYLVDNSYGVSKNSEIFFICKSGARSMHAALILESNGYNNLYNVEDGFVIGWKPSGLPSK